MSSTRTQRQLCAATPISSLCSVLTFTSRQTRISTKSIAASKRNYFSRMADELHNTQKCSKAYRYLLKRFLRNKMIPLIPPFSTIMSLWLTLKKLELFNSFFAEQCFLVNNNSKLSTNFNCMTEKRRSTVIVSVYEIDNTIRCLDPNKFHGQDKISICMFKICGNSICRQLEIF